MIVSRLVAAVAMVALAAGCDGGSTAAPSEPQYGTDTCARCRSTIKDPRFAAQYLLADGTAKLFDDPGCLVLSLKDETGAAAAIFVHDHDGERWLAAADASFAHTSRTETPRGYGWAAHASFGAAQDAVTKAGSGEILGWDQLRDRITRTPDAAGK
jgi:copper chaperone NosL